MNNVLLIDDDAAHRIVASRALKDVPLPLTVFQASNTKEALEHLSENEFALVVLDVKLDHESGIDLLPQIRKNNPNVPVIMVSTSDLEEHISASYASGANCYIIKGLDPTEYRKNLSQAARYFLYGC